MSEKLTAILVAHTHWDREWYDTFQQFRMRLVRLTDKLMDILETDPAYKNFTFDGQSIVIEDYLEARPSQRERLSSLIKNERILIGPWYVLPDEFLVSGEALIRNLMIGHSIAEQYGRPMKAGYLPDPFGHIAQLPQILKGFGIDSFIFSRGMGEEYEQMNSEFIWKALDGTEVLAINQVWGYCNMRGWGVRKLEDSSEAVDYELAAEKAEQQVDVLGPKASAGIILFNNGCDHQEPQPELPELIEYVNAKSERVQIIHSTYEDFVHRIREQRPSLKTRQGELHSGKYAVILPGVFSSRMYLKKMNERCQTWLEKYAEPTSALRWAVDGVHDSDFLRLAWKEVIRNHPHDSICGCSIDQVHREMVPRFQQSLQISERLTDWNLKAISDQVDTLSDNPKAQALLVFNPLEFETDDPVCLNLRLPAKDWRVPPGFIVKNSEGQQFPVQVKQVRLQQYHTQRAEWEFDIVFAAGPLPALGYQVFWIEPRSNADNKPSVASGPDWLENNYLRVTMNPNGSFTLIDRRSGAVYGPMNLFEDEGDGGDEYNFSPVHSGSGALTSSGIGGTLTITHKGSAQSSIRADFTFRVPKSLSADRSGRSAETVEIPVSTEVTLYPDSARVDVVTGFDNRACDHRLRALFNSGLKSQSHFAHTQFGVIERPNEAPEVRSTWGEKPCGTHASQSFVCVEDGQDGLCIIQQGLPEYEVMGETDATVALTLVRSVGWLSREDLTSRPVGAGPQLETPEAQCLGEQECRYAVLPYSGSWAKAQVWREAQKFNAPPLARLTSAHPGDLPASFSYFKVEPAAAVLSAFRKSERENAWIARVYNTAGDEIEAELVSGLPVKGARFADMNDNPQKDGDAPKVEGQTIRFKLRPFGIVTVAVYL